MRVILIPFYGMRLELHDVPDQQADNPATARPLTTGSLISDLKCPHPVDDEADQAYNDRVDGMEALILACACSGIDVASPAFVEAIETAYDAVSNQS